MRQWQGGSWGYMLKTKGGGESFGEASGGKSNGGWQWTPWVWWLERDLSTIIGLAAKKAAVTTIAMKGQARVGCGSRDFLGALIPT